MYVNALIFALAGLAFGLVLLWAGRQLSAGLTTDPARRPFESGAEPEVHAWNRYHVRYLNYALIFVLFDMEMVFMYPWAVVVAQIGPKAVIEMFGFLAVLVAGVVYAWREGAFRWT